MLTAEKKQGEQQNRDVFSARFNNFLNVVYDESKFDALSIDELNKLLEESKELQQQYKNFELIVKQDANSLYGTSASIYFSLVDFDIAGDITGTGKHFCVAVDININKFFVNWDEAELKILREFYPKLSKIRKFTEYKADTPNDVCVYGDTDSRYINLEMIYGFMFDEDGQPMKLPPNTADGNKELSDFSVFLMDKFINDIIRTTIEKDLEYRNGNVGYMKMAHEVTARRCVFQAKKKYVLPLIWKDGKVLEKTKLKVVGVELKKGELNKRIKGVLEILVNRFLLDNWTEDMLRQEVIKLIAYIKKRNEKSFIFKSTSVSGLKDITFDGNKWTSHKTHFNMKIAMFWYNFIESNPMAKDMYKLPFEGQKMNFYYSKDGSVVGVPDDVDIDSVKGLPEPDFNKMLNQILVKNLLKYIKEDKTIVDKDVESFLLGVKQWKFK